MTSKQIATGISLVMILFSMVALTASSAGATEVEIASNAVERVEKTALESGSPSSGPPFPRIYMMVHNELPDGYGGSACSTPLETDDSWDTLAALANIIEMKFEFGNQWKIDMDGDGDCDANDGDTYVVPWLEEQSNALPPNYRGVTIAHKQLAFGNGWYYHYDPPEPPTYWRIQHTQEVNQCVNQWPLRDTEGNLSHWTAETHPMVGLNVLDHAVYSGDSNVCNGDLYVDWWPDWIEAPVLGGVPAWDGVRLDLPGNMHKQFRPPTDMDLDGCEDVWENADGTCNTENEGSTYHGNVVFNEAHRDGIQEMFAQLHAQHPDWLIFGNNAWWPEDGSAEDPDPPGYASKDDINGTMVEDWTRNWWEHTAVGYDFSFSRWSSPDPSQGSQKVDFASSMVTFKQWQDAGKMLVINGKWCNLPKDGVVNGSVYENECGVDANGSGEVEENEQQPWRKSREVRFTMALATMLGEYHNYIGLGTGFVPYWFDEYAVIPDPDGPYPFKAAATKEEKAAGVGWLGWPAAPTEDEMWAVDASGDREMSLSQALAISNVTTRNNYINDHAWIRYFDHGVVLINPTDSTKTVHLEGDYYRFRGRSSTPGSIYFDTNYSVNDGSSIQNQTVMVPAREGLFLVRDHESLVTDVVSEEQFGEGAGWVCNEENPTCSCGNAPPGGWYPGCEESYCSDPCWDWARVKYPPEPVSGSHIWVGGDFEGHDYAALTFDISDLPANSVIDSMRLGVYADDTPVISLGISIMLQEDDYSQYRPWYVQHSTPQWIYSPDTHALLEDDESHPTLYLLNGAVDESELRFRSKNYGDGVSASKLHIAYRNVGEAPTPTPPTAVYQQGVNGYNSGEDTHIVTTNWEPPTPHDTYHVLYLRTGGGEDEVKSSLIRFNDITLPPGALITNAVLSLYFKGQSVNGGEIRAHVSATKPAWEPPQTTWVDYQSSDEWQAPGAKGVTDREYYDSFRVVDYTEVGTWLDFNVTQSVQNGVFEFILHASDMGVSKHIYFPSNEYWDASKRPKLQIWYE